MSHYNETRVGAGRNLNANQINFCTQLLPNSGGLLSEKFSYYDIKGLFMILTEFLINMKISCHGRTSIPSERYCTRNFLTNYFHIIKNNVIQIFKKSITMVRQIEMKKT